MGRTLLSAVLASVMLTVPVNAALLTNVQGTVTVNRGAGFAPASGGSIIAPGDRVRVAEGSAEIVYDNGCVVKLGPGQVVAVLYTPPACQSGTGGDDTAVYVAGGGLLLGGAIAGGILLSQGNHKAASP